MDKETIEACKIIIGELSKYTIEEIKKRHPEINVTNIIQNVIKRNSELLELYKTAKRSRVRKRVQKRKEESKSEYVLLLNGISEGKTLKKIAEENSDIWGDYKEILSFVSNRIKTDRDRIREYGEAKQKGKINLIKKQKGEEK